MQLILRYSLWAFPFGSRYPLYLFCLFKTKKDAAFIANAASNIHFGHQEKNKSIVIKPIVGLLYQ